MSSSSNSRLTGLSHSSHAHSYVQSVGAESPLDLPEREYDLLHPYVDGHEITWKYK